MGSELLGRVLHPRQAELVPIGGLLLGTALITALIALIQLALPTANLAVLYLLVVLFCAVTWGWWNALGAAVAAFLTYDFCFVQPRFTFSIQDPDEWISLLSFLVVAAVTSNLAARERARREQANRQASTATFLYDIGRALGGNDLDRGLRDVAERLVREFGLAGAVIATSDAGGGLHLRVAVGACDGALDSAPVGRVFQPSRQSGRAGRWVVLRSGAGKPNDRVEGARHGRAPVANFPLRRDDQALGMLRLLGRRDGFADDETRLLATVADRVAVALERETLREEANRAEILRRTDELRTALLNSVSHDLRTPLAAIKASAESLLQHDVAWSDEDRDGFAAAIDREADRLNRLVANLLDMSRIEGGALRPNREWYDLGELVREVVARLGPSLKGRAVKLTIPDDVPPVALDYLMVDQVVTNLIENASKYTPLGAPLAVAVRETAGGVRVEVEDRGTGIPPDKRERIFDKFYRLETRGATRGSGLGLAVSRGLIEGHGGRIWVEAGAGPVESPGARFVFELPRDQIPAGLDAEGPPSATRLAYAGRT